MSPSSANNDKMTLITSKPVDPNWWRQALVYQIYPRSFCDANGDGIGDLKGITSKVPYLRELGVDAVWLSPFYPSALKDGGYDVADYRDVDPKIGTLEDFDEMTAAFKKAGIQVIVDIVPNHSSDDHVWFQEALRSPKGSNARNRYIFRDGSGPDGNSPPADWVSCFGGPSWTQVPDGQWYLHLFDTSQPDLNWNHPDVPADFLKTLKFWADRGVAGFRVDVAMGLAKDIPEHGPYPTNAELSDSRLNFTDAGQFRGQQHPLWDRDEVLEIYKEWRALFNQYDPPLTAVAEAWVATDRKHLYASAEGLGQTFSFDMLMSTYSSAAYLETIKESLRQAKESGSSTTWVFSNHDVLRHATRYGIEEYTTASGVNEYNQLTKDFLLGEKGIKCDIQLGIKRARAATLMLLALPGSAYIYQGEELGLPEVVDIPAEARQDPTFFRWKGREIGRDGCRVPLPWTKEPKSFGFSPENAKAAPHLPPPTWWGEYAAAEEEKDEKSTLNLYKKALNLRKKLQAAETLELVGDTPGVVHFKRPNGWEVVFNVSNDEGVEVPAGEVLVASGELKDGKIGRDTAVWVNA